MLALLSGDQHTELLGQVLVEVTEDVHSVSDGVYGGRVGFH
jgi:hypothetical protein